MKDMKECGAVAQIQLASEQFEPDIPAKPEHFNQGATPMYLLVFGLGPNDSFVIMDRFLTSLPSITRIILIYLFLYTIGQYNRLIFNEMV
jgi:hypothetical protein